jgi:hypothetical protein
MRKIVLFLFLACFSGALSAAEICPASETEWGSLLGAGDNVCPAGTIDWGVWVEEDSDPCPAGTTHLKNFDGTEPNAWVKIIGSIAGQNALGSYTCSFD